MISTDPADPRMEALLRQQQPANFPDDLADRVELAWLAQPTSPSTASPLRSPPTPRLVRSHSPPTWLRPFLRWRWAAALVAGIVLGLLSLDQYTAERQIATQPPPQPPPQRSSLSPLTPTADSNLRPASVVNEIMQARDDGVIATVGNVPVRRLRYQMRETVRWENPHTGSTVEVSGPCEEIWLLPVSTY